MHQNFIHSNITEALPGMARAVLLRGDEVGSRNGRTKELTHVGITLSRPWQREILIPERKANIAAQIAETMWVLTGRDDIGWLRQYLPRAEDFSDDGERWRGAYGPRLRAWPVGPDDVHVDQWGHVLDTLKADPLSRRTTISIYNPEIDVQPGLDIPCNNWLVFTNRLGYLDLQVGIRSNDLMWGWSGINAFEWSALLEISAALLGVRVGSLHFSVASLHLYENHWPKAERIAQQYPTPDVRALTDSPRFKVPESDATLAGFDWLADEWMSVEAMIREQGAASAAARVDNFPEPMLQSWLRVLQWWWSGDHQYLKDIGGTRLEYATHVAMQPPSREDRKVNPCPVCGGELTHGHHYPGATGHPANEPPSRETTGVSAGESAVVASAGHQPPSPQPTYEITEEGSALLVHTFIGDVCALHDQKHAAYGDSWKRRGEMLGIMANIARKIDRLGKSETSDETSADTAGDLLVYLAKYQAWLFDQRNGTVHSDGTEWPNNYLKILDRQAGPTFQPVDAEGRALLEGRLRDRFEDLETMVTHDHPEKRQCLDRMAMDAYLLARSLDQRERFFQEPDDADEYRGADHD